MFWLEFEAGQRGLFSLAVRRTALRCDTQFSQAWEEMVMLYVSQVLVSFRVCQLYFSGLDSTF